MDFFIFSLFRRFEAFLIYETSGGKRTSALLFFALMIPGPLKFLPVFLLVTRLLPATLAEKKMRLLLSLPFSRTELFIYSFLFGFSILFSATSVGWALFDRSGSPEFMRYFVFYVFYFGITLINALKIGPVMFLPMLLLLFDLVSPFVAPEIYAFLSQYSPLYQQNQPLSMLASLAVLLISFLIFVFGRREEW